MTAVKVTIKAIPRTILGRASKQLRVQGIVPGVLYGHNFKPVSVQVDGKEFQKCFSEAGETTLVYVALGDQSYPTIIHDVAKDAVSDKVLHVDFYKVKLDEKIHAKIPVELAGTAPAVKDFGGILLKHINELEVEGFPQDLPHQLIADVSVLKNIGEQILVKDLAISNKLKLTTNLNDIVVLIQAPISEEKLKEQLETSTGTAAEDVEVITKEKKEGEVAEDGTTSAEASVKPAKEESKK